MPHQSAIELVERGSTGAFSGTVRSLAKLMIQLIAGGLFLAISGLTGIAQNAALVAQLTEKERSFLKEHPVIRVGGQSDWAPYDFVDSFGRHQGIAADYLSVLGEKLGVEFQVSTNRNWSQLLAAVENREVDLLVALWRTPDREDFLAFTAPYAATVNFIFAHEDNKTIKQATDLLEKRVASVSGYATEGQLRALELGMEFIEVPDILSALLLLMNGGADAFVGDVYSTSYLIQENTLTGLKLAASADLPEQPVCMGARSDWPELASILDKAFASLTPEEQFAILRRWTSFDTDAFIDFRLIWQVGVVGLLIIGIVMWRNLALRRVMKQQRLAEEQTQLLLDSTSEGIFGVDTNGRITFVNAAACELLGFSEDEMIGELSHKLIHYHRPDGSDYPVEECPMYSAYTGGKASRIDDEFLWQKGGKGLLVEYGATPMRKDGEVVGAVISFTDVTERKEAEAGMLESQERFELAVHGSGDALWEYDLRTGVNWFSPLFLEILGYAHGEIPNTLETWKSHVHPEDEQAAVDAFSAHLAGDIPYDIQYRMRTKSGRHIWVRARAKSLRGGDGVAYRTSGSISDVTERKAAEEELKQANFLADMGLELTKSGYWHVDYSDPDYYYQSERAARMVGEEIKPDGRYHLQNEWFNRVMEADPEFAKETAEKYQGAIDGKYPNYDAIYAYKRPSDRQIVWLHASGSLVRDKSGRVLFMYGVYQDITDAKKTEAELKAGEERLRKTEQFYRGVLELAPDGLMVVGEGGIIQLANAQCEKLFGFTRDELIGKPVEMLVPEDVRDGHPALREKFHHDPAVRDMGVGTELRAVRKDGSIFPVEVGLSPLATSQGDDPQVAVSIRDVTERRVQEDALKEAKASAEDATEMKSMFLANMSHEIRTPMNAIIGLSYLALKTELNAKQRDYVSKVHNAGTSLLAIINDILDFSKIEAGKLEIESTEFVIDEVIASVTTLTAQKAHEKGLEFLAHVSPDIPDMLRGDPLRLGQILTNFVNNAVKFTEMGEIHLDIQLAERTGKKAQLKFAVRDTGIGMSKEQAAKLFQPFTQADMSTTRKHGGTGLGLTIARRLVELMDGRAWLESEAGAGSTFFFTAWLGIGESKASGKVVPEKLAQLRVLVVDDNPSACEILEEPLSSLAAHVDVAGSGEEAIHAIRRHDSNAPYDIVFMDWRMPGMDGLQASRHIKSDEMLRHPPAIVLVTAFGREEVREEAERLELDGFLVKPVTKSMVVDTLVSVYAELDELPDTQESSGQAVLLTGVRVLLAEDNEINQQIAIELLEGTGASVKVANNGREAVDVLFSGPQRPPFDVVLMDLQMPVMDGHQAVAKIRSDSRFAELPVLAMTAHATLEERQRCLDGGMNDHISKPIDPTLLFETVARYCKSRIAAGASEEAVTSTIVEPDQYRTSGDEIPKLAGLDTADGLTRVAGNRKLYVKLLRKFLDQADAPDDIATAIAAADIELAVRIAHTVKGVAGNLGASGVQSIAGKLESAILKRAEAPVQAGLLDEFRETLGEFLARLSGALPEQETRSTPVFTNSSLNTEEAAPVVKRMIAHLNNFDSVAEEYLESNRAVFQCLLSSEAFAAFEQHLSEFDFSEALTQLELAANEKGLATG